jgi:hypothetical protein
MLLRDSSLLRSGLAGVGYRVLLSLENQTPRVKPYTIRASVGLATDERLTFVACSSRAIAWNEDYATPACHVIRDDLEGCVLENQATHHDVAGHSIACNVRMSGPSLYHRMRTGDRQSWSGHWCNPLLVDDALADSRPLNIRQE